MRRHAYWLMLLVAACRAGASPEEPAVEVPREVTVAETWLSVADTMWDLDTPALWARGDTGLVLVTGKGSHDIRVFDLQTGEARSAIGSQGEALGQFNRPNAVLVHRDLAFVIERDNHRVQILRMPTGTPVGSFGEGELQQPYGGVIAGALPELTFYITDDYDAPLDSTADLSRRVHRFRVRLDGDGAATVIDHAAIGQRSGPAALRVVETIGRDPDGGLLYVADESQKSYLVFDSTGSYTGRILAQGLITGDPEGMALVECGETAGFWIVTDQQPTVSWFRVFRRDNLEYVGAFRGQRTTNTDGVSFAPGPVPGFPAGVFLTVHDDQAVSAFDWAHVAESLGIGCPA